MTENTKKHQAVWDWLYQNRDISDLYFTQGEYDANGELVLNNQIIYTPETVGSDVWKRQFIRDKGIKEYSFKIRKYQTRISELSNAAACHQQTWLW